jgi:hypothetical protein
LSVAIALYFIFVDIVPPLLLGISLHHLVTTRHHFVVVVGISAFNGE